MGTQTDEIDLLAQSSASTLGHPDAGSSRVSLARPGDRRACPDPADLPDPRRFGAGSRPAVLLADQRQRRRPRSGSRGVPEPDLVHPEHGLYVGQQGADNRVMCRATNEARGSFVSVAPADVIMACSTNPCPAAPVMGQTVSVTVTGHFRLITPLLAVFFGGQDTSFASTASAQLLATPTAVSIPGPVAAFTVDARLRPDAAPRDRHRRIDRHRPRLGLGMGRRNDGRRRRTRTATPTRPAGSSRSP